MTQHAQLCTALLLAPLFVWIEFLFMCGYRPKLRKRLDEKAVKAIAEWKKASTTKLKRKS